MVKYRQVFISWKRNHNININKPNLNLKYVVIIGFPPTYSLSPHWQVPRSVAGRWKCLPALCIIATYCAFRGCGLEHVYCLTAPCRLRCPSCHYLLPSVWFQPLWSEKEGRRQVIPSLLPQADALTVATFSCDSLQKDPCGLSRHQMIAFPRVCCCCFPVAQLCPTLCDPMSCSTLGLPVLIELVMPSHHLVLCHPLLLLLSVFPSIRVFSNELALRIR